MFPEGFTTRSARGSQRSSHRLRSLCEPVQMAETSFEQTLASLR